MSELRTNWRQIGGMIMGVLGLMGVFLGGVRGVEDGEDFPVLFELVSEDEVIRPGERFTVGLRLRHDPGWHTYWKNPGIVGVPTSIEWTLPEGFRAGEIQWPQPEVVKMAQLDAYGYENEALLLIDVEAPEDFGGMTAVTLRAKVVYMACASTCHPGFIDLELRLPLASGGERQLDEEMHGLFDKTRATFAKDMGEHWKFDAWRAGEKLYLKIMRGEGADGAGVEGLAGRVYYFDLTGQVDSSVAQEVLERDGEEAFVMELATATWGPKDAEYLEGILYSPAGWMENGDAERAMKVRVPLRERE